MTNLMNRELPETIFPGHLIKMPAIAVDGRYTLAVKLHVSHAHNHMRVCVRLRAGNLCGPILGLVFIQPMQWNFAELTASLHVMGIGEGSNASITCVRKLWLLNGGKSENLIRADIPENNITLDTKELTQVVVTEQWNSATGPGTMKVLSATAEKMA